jgi:MFS superfamily sulfate permease-like transporter
MRLHGNANGPITNDWRSNFRKDFPASIVVFLVALPLCMGVAIASGAPVAAGLITGIVGGLVVGTLAGSPLQVSGPAAGLTVIIFDLIQQHGLEMLGITVLVAGALQLLAGIFRLGQWFRAVSPAVIKGMLAGIGVLIFASQFHVMVDDRPKGTGLQNLATIPEAVAKGLEVPEFGTKEERQLRTNKLREIGELHRLQVDLQERIAERLPRHETAEQWAAETDESMAVEAAALTALLQNQQEITQRLDRAVEILQTYEPEMENGDKSGQIRSAAVAALAYNEQALRDIEAGRVQEVKASQHEAVASMEVLLGRLKNHSWAAEIGILTILIILLWQSFAPKKLKVVPAPLLAVAAATAVAVVLSAPVLYVEVPDNLAHSIHMPSLSLLQGGAWIAVLQGAIVIAVVASAETLLCCTAVDQLHQGPRTKYDKELAAQGVGNMICGFLGALPMTGVIVRSAANVQAGARTRMSAVLHGFWLLLFVVALGFVLRLIPTAALAAMLVYTGYKLVNIKAIRELWKYGKGEVVIYAATVGTIVVQDLLAGVLVGIALSGLKLLYTFSHLKSDLQIEEDGKAAVLRLEGSATFIRLPLLAKELERVPQQAALHVDLQHLSYIDHACLDLLMNWAKQHKATGGSLVVDWDSLHAKFREENGANGKPAVKTPPQKSRAMTASE